MRQRLAAIGIGVVLGLLGSVPRTEALPFVTVGEGWDGPGLGSADLTFYFGVSTPDLSLDLQHTALIAALDAWASVAALTFTETSIAHQPRSIDFNFETNGVSSGFLAFGFFPPPPSPEPIGGDIFFNDNVLWEVGNDLGFNAYDLELLAAHEIGHALGLNHSTTPNALMRPFFSAGDVFVGLHPDDAAGIDSLYAPVAVPEPSTLPLASVGLVAVLAKSRRR
jgi:hypothetical protein